MIALPRASAGGLQQGAEHRGACEQPAAPRGEHERAAVHPEQHRARVFQRICQHMLLLDHDASAVAVDSTLGRRCRSGMSDG
jgi:hypothetical protein